LRSAYSTCIPAFSGPGRYNATSAIRSSNLLDERAHARAFQLEDTGGDAAVEHLVDAFVIERDVVDVEVDAGAPQVRQGVLDHRECPQSEEVHLQ
jgi:hypothetical protein